MKFNGKIICILEEHLFFFSVEKIELLPIIIIDSSTRYKAITFNDHNIDANLKIAKEIESI